MRVFLSSTCLLIASIVPPSTSRAAPFEKLPGNRIRHAISGFVFPGRIGQFERQQSAGLIRLDPTFRLHITRES